MLFVRLCADAQSKKPPELHIKQDARKRVFVEGGESTVVTTAEQLQAQLDYGMDHRHVSATNMNAVSCERKPFSYLYVRGSFE